ncbi:MAG: aminotransferase class V-fold PLP-dependent enzyme [Planctomycetaceae bacterium]|nr:aminotransferase class V-fold PLP-dependent enzyme [Planctomycetaceae bacterium]
MLLDLPEFDLSPPWKDLWSIDPENTYLNFGSFGPSPRAVQEVQHQILREIERQPARFFFRTREDYYDKVTNRLAQYFGTKGDNLLLVNNATVAMNIVSQSFPLEPGDEVLLNNHEYGAVQLIWREACQRQGATFGIAQITHPITSPEDVIESLFSRVTDRTRLIVLSHITSPTAIQFPVKEICQRARERDIAVCVDGPHALLMHPVQLDDLGCQYYTASCHKWLMAPFGSGFLYTRGALKSNLKPHVTSWGRSISGRPKHWKDPFLWQGTDNDAALLSLSATLDFWNKLGAETYRQHSFPLIQQVQERITKLFPREPISMLPPEWQGSMISIPIGESSNEDRNIGVPDGLQNRLLEEFGIEIPVTYWNGLKLLRVSIHLCTEQKDIDYLVETLTKLKSEGQLT